MKNTLRIAIGGIAHETNTFSPVPTGYEKFNKIQEKELLNVRLSSPSHTGVDLVPTIFAEAIPCGLIRKTAYTRLKEELLGEIRSALPLDGVYLDLHGAMEVEEIGDAEGDLAIAVRNLAGPEAIIAVSLDLHGNISHELVDNSNVLTAYRTAPHCDREETRQRALNLLIHSLKTNIHPISVLVKPPIILAGESVVTNREPAKSLYERLVEIDRVQGVMDSSFLVGCAWTDSPNTAASIIVVAESERDLALKEANKFAKEVWEQRNEYNYGVETGTIEESVKSARDSSQYPVFISDSGDNVTAGAPGDRIGILEHLINVGAEKALVAGLNDSEAVKQCAYAGVGAEVKLSLGGKISPQENGPLIITARVTHLTTGTDKKSGEPAIALIECKGISVILTVDNRAFPDRKIMEVAGIDPMKQEIVVVKQGYLFPDLQKMAPRSIMALSPGATDLKLENLNYKRLNRPIFPLDGDTCFPN